MNSRRKFARRTGLVILALWGTLLLLAACGEQTPTPITLPSLTRTSVPPAGTVTPTAIPTVTPEPSPTPAVVLVSILNKRLTHAEIADVVRGEGTVVVAEWNYAAREAMAEQFQAWVKNEYGVEVRVEYPEDAAPETYLKNVYDAQEVNAPSPYDVVAVDESIFVEAQQRDAVERVFPSDLLSNAGRVAEALKREPYAIAFQSSGTVAPIFHRDAVGEWFRDWKDLADPRMKRRFTIPEADGYLAGGFLIGVPGALNKDYKNPEQMRESIDFVCEQIVPNAYTITSDLNFQQQLLRENRVDAAVGWNLLARLEGLSEQEGTQDIVFRPMTSGQLAMNGYAWVPKGAPHPVLAQLWINWRLSDDGQLPGEAWGLSKRAWGEYHEGLPGASYEASIPEWLKAEYGRYYPSVSDMANLYKPVDWDYYAAHQAEWMKQYGGCAK